MNDIIPGKVFYLKDAVNIKPGRIASRRLVLSDIPGMPTSDQEWVLYAMDQQETISSETSPQAKVIHVLEGELHMQVAGQSCQLATGASIIVPANTWHEFAARKGCKFLQISI
ncbi:D-lyxose/D-mannose family sugar isomerase [Paenibacillus brevis]|uniref:Cupin domain-containing protein n=1 Tax=Paenibacillus brevis TaxID=2841508 RepID=A0ABS6FUU3_9BACL|nr:D-lyxose/D-mannose family sugar isomerase [Paenibacillus brevis]MBU5673153.1 cupin domain-containing protein [Paenibacillus brevis]